MIIKHNSDSIVIKREKNETIDGTFDGFVCDFYNDNDSGAGYISELEYAGNNCAGYYIAGHNDCKPFAVFVDNYDYDNMLNEGKTVLPYYHGWTDDQIQNLVFYGNDNPDVVLPLQDNEENNIYFNYSDIDTTVFDIYSLCFCNDNEEIEYSIDFPTECDMNWYINLCNIDVINYENIDDCSRDAYIINENDRIESDAVTVRTNEHLAYTRAR